LVPHYQGLLVCDCLHGPFGMKIAYFSMGAFYFFLLVFFEKIFPSRKLATDK
jgi:hypothetical protein